MDQRFRSGGPTFPKALRAAAGLLIAVLCGATSAAAALTAELQAKTIAAFDRYVAATEAQRRAAPQFLWIDTNTPELRKWRDRVRMGELFIDELETRDAGKKIDIPDALVHHWLGVVFVPKATLDQAVSLLQDYDRHADIYKPNVARSRLLSRDGDTFRVYLRFFTQKLKVSATVNSEHEGRFTRVSPRQVESRIVSTRIAQVENPDQPQERELPVGKDEGYLWRLNSYWRFEERDGGVYVQCESVSLSRELPFFPLSLIIKPFVTSVPRETLTFTLETTRKTMQAR